MNQQLIDIARKAGLIGMRPHLDGIYIEALEAFAALVAAAEREACLNLADSLGWVNVDHIRARGQA